ncbi:hypothetical protein AAFF_G00394900 [Aldrovandia affinis]|uniref:Uncharacterized protein n=1 Tax=Aldrovandia affinis TaxID=143900 RepID=A0AAD7WKU2_9TELE|nr:hypothetical protein AAFF_G00394900 [Aldrovandia affinis]
MKRQYAELQKSGKEQLNMAKAQEDSRELSPNFPLQQQWRSTVVKRKAINDRVCKTTSGCQRKEGGGTLSRLQEELADVQRKLSAYETRMGLNIRRLNDLMKEKMDLQQEVDDLRDELRQSEDMCVRSERRFYRLKNVSESNQREDQAFYMRLYNLMRRVLGMVWGFR